jgi:uncharacterized membrane protein
MQQRFNFLKTTLLGGIVFLLPLALLGIVIGKVVQVMMLIAESIDQWIPSDSFVNVILVNLVGLVIVIFACFFAGLVTKSLFGQRMFQFLESKLSILPGYAVFKARLTGNLGSEVEKKSLIPVMIHFKDQSQIGFQVEKLHEQRMMVFLPGAPDPWSGNLVVVNQDQIEPLHLDALELMTVFEKLGKGAAAVLEKSLAKST